MTVRVTAGGRLHFGFLNLSLVHERLYGGIGVAIDGPSVTFEVEPAEGIVVDPMDDVVEGYATIAVEELGVPGAALQVRSTLPGHVGLGSGTQTALAVLAGIAAAYDESIEVSELAPSLGRGGRSGVGIATFEGGGFVIDAGHPTGQFTNERPPAGEWRVPPPMIHLPFPEDWRFVIAIPEVPAGRHGPEEDRSIRTIVAGASPTVADRIAAICLRRLLPGLVEARIEAVGRALTEIGRLNGAWYAEEQGGVYRPPIGDVIRELEHHRSIAGAGQSSWGPLVYGLVEAEDGEIAADAGRTALEACDLDGTVEVVEPRNVGAEVRVLD